MITIKTILCPVDFFPASDAAVNYAAGLAANYDAVVHLVHVVTPVAAGIYEYAIDIAEIIKSLEERSAQEMNTLAAKVKEAGVSVETELRLGDVYDEIKQTIEAAK